MLTIEPGSVIVKDPQAERTYLWDWTALLDQLGQTITTQLQTVTGPDALLVIDSASIVTGSKKTQARIKGGTSGAKYTWTVRIVTNGSPANTIDKSVGIWVEDE